MRTLVLLFLVCLVACTPKGKSVEKEEWIQLFNGTDLTGWTLRLQVTK